MVRLTCRYLHEGCPGSEVSQDTFRCMTDFLDNTVNEYSSIVSSRHQDLRDCAIRYEVLRRAIAEWRTEQENAISDQDLMEIWQEATRILDTASDCLEVISLFEGNFEEQILQTLTTMLADEGWCEHHRRSLEDLQSATDPVETVGAVTLIRWVLQDRHGDAAAGQVGM